MTDDVSGAGAYRDQTNDEKHHDALNDVRRLLRHGCNILGETGQSNRRREPSQDLQISACDSDPPRRIRSPAALPLHSSVETTELAYEGREFHLLFTARSECKTPMGDLILVTTDDCHFCERAETVLDGLGVARREIPVDSEEAGALAARGIALAFLPVLTDGSRIIAYGRFSEKHLRRELDAEPVS